MITYTKVPSVRGHRFQVHDDGRYLGTVSRSMRYSEHNSAYCWHAHKGSFSYGTAATRDEAVELLRKGKESS
jgi:hypothetical protein